MVCVTDSKNANFNVGEKIYNDSEDEVRTESRHRTNMNEMANIIFECSDFFFQVFEWDSCGMFSAQMTHLDSALHNHFIQLLLDD